MKLQPLITNKKIVIVAITLVLALLVGIVVLVTRNFKETGGKDTNIKTEQSKGDKEDASAKDNEDDNSDLKVLKPDEDTPENSSDASGSWGNAPDSETQGGNTNKTDDQSQNNNSNDSDKGDYDESEKNGDILEDDITWGDIY